MALSNTQQIMLMKKKLNNLAADIKAVREQGRLISDPKGLHLFRGMYCNLHDTYKQFLNLWDELLSIYIVAEMEADFPTDKENTCFQNVKKMFYETCAISEQHKSDNSAVLPQDVTTHSRARLPKIALPQFAGNPTDWQLFKDSYLSLVHNDAYLSSIEKYHFLVGSLRGTALSVIKSIPFTEDNYAQAWQALMKKYDSKRRLASSYLSQLINFKPLTGKASASSLNNFLLSVAENITSFKNLDIPNTADYILFELVIRCLDPITREAFEVSNADVEFPAYSSLIKFVENRAHALSIMDTSEFHISDQKSASQKRTVSKSIVTNRPNPSSFFVNDSNRTSSLPQHSSSSFTPGPPTCFLCKNLHKLTNCQTYISYSPQQRFELLKNWAGCKNCLYPGHKTKACQSKWKCRECGGRHHTTLHLSKSPVPHTDQQKPSSINSSNANENPVAKPQTSLASVLTSTSASHTNVLLGTAIVQIQDVHGSFHNIRLIIDSGSQYSFISENCFKKLGLSSLAFDKCISGVGHSTLQGAKATVSCILRPVKRTTPEISTVAVIIPTITPCLPQTPVPYHIWQSYIGYDLADPEFWQPAPVDFLLGADLFMQVITGSPITVNLHYPQILETIFGYIVAGKYNANIASSLPAISCLAQTKGEINTIMSKFWEIEEVNSEIPIAPEDAHCEHHFNQSHYRLSTGRYVVSLPFKTSHVNLATSKYQPLNRLYNLESKLSKDAKLRHEYHDFISEYIQLGHMHKTETVGKYIIPHHAVHKLVQDVPKIRVVFDGSSKTSSGSLNDHLLAGPKLQKDIGDIILNFRRHRYALTTDIVKMYRQILICDNDRQYQHILWRFNLEDKVQEYELTTVTYGLKSSPFLALRVIQQLIIDEGDRYPMACAALAEDIYVDDIVTGASSISNLITLKEQLIQLLSKGCFSLSKWASNCPEIFDSSNESSEQPLLLCESEDFGLKILGMQWDPKSDVFSYLVHLPSLPLTKRGILSGIARIYDPLGYISPVIFLAKRILQDTWRLGIGWDDPVPSDILKAWSSFIEDIPNVKHICIPRYLSLRGCDSDCNIFGFCDASQAGYCAVLYLSVIDGSENKFYLIKAKTKLAPIKAMTIPRLELCAALLLTSLYSSIANFRKNLNVGIVGFFTDSSVVLSWLRTPSHLLKTFVAHRVVRILDSTDLSWWRHVTSCDNPADCGSRGMLASQLIGHKLWWSGPTWIHQPETYWPSTSIDNSFNSTLELKSTGTALVSTATTSDFITWMERFSKYLRLVRSMAYVLRFTTFIKAPKRRGPVTCSEFKSANLRCIKLLQQFYYPEAFKENSKLSNLLLSLNTFKDHDGVLRVGGRLKNSGLSDQQRYPILLPRRSHYTTLIVDYFHHIHLLAGISVILAAIQRCY